MTAREPPALERPKSPHMWADHKELENYREALETYADGLEHQLAALAPAAPVPVFGSANETNSLLVRNPAPDASPAREPTNYRIFQTSAAQPDRRAALEAVAAEVLWLRGPLAWARTHLANKEDFPLSVEHIDKLLEHAAALARLGQPGEVKP